MPHLPLPFSSGPPRAKALIRQHSAAHGEAQPGFRPMMFQDVELQLHNTPGTGGKHSAKLRYRDAISTTGCIGKTIAVCPAGELAGRPSAGANEEGEPCQLPVPLQDTSLSAYTIATVRRARLAGSAASTTSSRRSPVEADAWAVIVRSEPATANVNSGSAPTSGGGVPLVLVT